MRGGCRVATREHLAQVAQPVIDPGCGGLRLAVGIRPLQPLDIVGQLAPLDSSLGQSFVQLRAAVPILHPVHQAGDLLLHVGKGLPCSRKLRGDMGLLAVPCLERFIQYGLTPGRIGQDPVSDLVQNHPFGPIAAELGLTVAGARVVVGAEQVLTVGAADAHRAATAAALHHAGEQVPRMMGGAAGAGTFQLAPGTAGGGDGIIVPLEQLLGLLEGLVVNDLQVREVAQPLLVFLRRTLLLVDLARQRVAYVGHFAPAPAAKVFAVPQQPRQVLVAPLRLGRAVVLGGGQAVQFPRDPAQCPSLMHEPVKVLATQATVSGSITYIFRGLTLRPRRPCSLPGMGTDVNPKQ